MESMESNKENFVIVDTHQHVVDKDSVLQTASTTGYKRHVVTPDMIFEAWKPSNIKYGVLSQPSFLGYNNSALANALKTGRFRGIIMLDWSKTTEKEL